MLCGGGEGVTLFLEKLSWASVAATFQLPLEMNLSHSGMGKSVVRKSRGLRAHGLCECSQDFGWSSVVSTQDALCVCVRGEGGGDVQTEEKV